MLGEGTGPVGGTRAEGGAGYLREVTGDFSIQVALRGRMVLLE